MKMWFDIRFTDGNGNEYRDSILAEDILQVRNLARTLHLGLVGSGEIYQLADDGSRIGDPISFRMSQWEGDRDAV